MWRKSTFLCFHYFFEFSKYLFFRVSKNNVDLGGLQTQAQTSFLTPTSYKWGYNSYKWPYNWVTGVITLFRVVITPLITGIRGPPCRKVQKYDRLKEVNQSSGAAETWFLESSLTSRLGLKWLLHQK